MCKMYKKSRKASKQADSSVLTFDNSISLN
nr:MAG TPA: NO APICAL MERISTEM PROTEIN REGULATION, TRANSCRIPTION, TRANSCRIPTION FACTOR.9A [Bacteriophage sp.]